MEKSKAKSIILYISYTAVLIAVLIKLDEFFAVISQMLLLFMPLFLGAAIAFILKIPYDIILSFLSKRLKGKRKGALRLISAVAVYILLCAIIAVIISFIVPQLMNSWDMLKTNLNSIVPSLYEKLEMLQQNLPLGQFAPIGETLSLNRISDLAGKLLLGVMPQLFSMTNSIVKTAANVIMGLVFSVYILIEREAISLQCKRFIKAFTGEKWYRRIIKISSVANETFTKFIGGQLTEAFILGGLCFIGMVILRLEYAPLVSVLVGLTSLIPIVGAFIGAIPSVFILFMISPQKALIFILFLIALQQFEGNVIYPKVVGGSIGLPPLWILLAITVGGGMFGVLGMMLSVPVVSVIYKLVCDEMDARLKDSDTI